MLKYKKSELLLPVGNMFMCLAAIHNGADAIYVGMPHFNARGRTTDFDVPQLKEMIEICHLYGVRVNLAFNVVIFQDEISSVISLLKLVLPLGPDADSTRHRTGKAGERNGAKSSDSWLYSDDGN